MPVIGTAGHVDHGKTALIAALTGIDTDRLPEEKARGMTTDLGFAHFKGGGMTIGVIDVPGHERYMRNMVAGAWGIDGAMLVVAADDGWMEQTARHAEVLAALGVPIIVIVVTKADTVPEARVAIVAEEARSRLAELSPTVSPPWVAVDSLRGRGIAELGGILIAALGALGAKPAGEAAPFLFADRAFTLPGPGLVVTGSLRGGPLSAGDELLLLPAGERLRVRSLQRYGVPAQVAEPGSRVAISFLKSRTTLARGDCLASPESSFRATKSCYLALDRRYTSWKPRTGLTLESATGTVHVDAQLWLARTPGFIRVVFDVPVATAPGQAVILLRKGGADILASGRVLAIGGEAADDRRRIEAVLPSAREAALVDGASIAQVRGAFDLAYAGCLPLGSGLALPA
ncbi:MAG: GTP-binding protein, partial [Spirochaetota bacterium]